MIGIDSHFSVHRLDSFKQWERLRLEDARHESQDRERLNRERINKATKRSLVNKGSKDDSDPPDKKVNELLDAVIKKYYVNIDVKIITKDNSECEIPEDVPAIVMPEPVNKPECDPEIEPITDDNNKIASKIRKEDARDNLIHDSWVSTALGTSVIIMSDKHTLTAIMHGLQYAINFRKNIIANAITAGLVMVGGLGILSGFSGINKPNTLAPNKSESPEIKK